MNAVSYFEAWGLWWHGALPPDYTMGWFPIFAWERIGKLMGFFGGLTVVLDIVGAPAVRAFGKRLRDLITFRHAVQRMFYSMGYAVEEIPVVKAMIYHTTVLGERVYVWKSPARERHMKQVRAWFEWEKKHQKMREIDEWSDSMTGGFMVLLTLVAILVAMSLPTHYWSGAMAIMFLVLFLVAYTFFTVFMLGYLLPSVLGGIMVTTSVLALVVDAVIDRIADVLEHPKSDKLIKIVGVGLFLIGFHFDLLGS